MTEEKIVDLGWMNGWGGIFPEQHKKCCSEKHYLKDWEIKKLGRSAEKVTCTKCRICWSVDSSD